MTDDLIPHRYWQPITVTCACGRGHGGHRIERWESSGTTTWVGEWCGTLTIYPHDVEPGTPGPGLAPEDKAPSSRLRPRADRWPTWWGRCQHCGLDVRIGGDKLHILLCEYGADGRQRIELRTIGEAAAARRRSAVEGQC